MPLGTCSRRPKQQSKHRGIGLSPKDTDVNKSRINNGEKRQFAPAEEFQAVEAETAPSGVSSACDLPEADSMDGGRWPWWGAPTDGLGQGTGAAAAVLSRATGGASPPRV